MIISAILHFEDEMSSYFKNLSREEQYEANLRHLAECEDMVANLDGEEAETIIHWNLELKAARKALETEC